MSLIGNATCKPHKGLYVFIFIFYIAQGLPTGLITQALPALLRDYGFSRALIGWSGLLLAPWSFKWLWAHYVNTHFSANLGASRSWILLTQTAIVIIFLILAGLFFAPISVSTHSSILNQSTTTIFIAALLLLSLNAATQDIAVDGLTVRLFHTQKTHTANAIQISAVRMGNIIGGGLFLMFLGWFGLSPAWLMLTAVSACILFFVLIFNESKYVHISKPTSINREKSSNSKTTINLKHIQQKFKQWKQHYQFLWHTPAMRAWLAVLVVFKLTDGLASGMVKPMMVDMHISLATIGGYGTIGGITASIIGAAFTPYIVNKTSHFWGLLLGNGLLIVCAFINAIIAYFAFLPYSPANLNLNLAPTLSFLQQGILLNNWLEHFAASVALVSVFSISMQHSRYEHAGSDFTVQISLLMALAGLGHLVSGVVADAFGYRFLFTLAGTLGFLSIASLFYWQNTAQKS